MFNMFKSVASEAPTLSPSYNKLKRIAACIMQICIFKSFNYYKLQNYIPSKYGHR